MSVELIILYFFSPSPDSQMTTVERGTVLDLIKTTGFARAQAVRFLRHLCEVKRLQVVACSALRGLPYNRDDTEYAITKQGRERIDELERRHHRTTGWNISPRRSA